MRKTNNLDDKMETLKRKLEQLSSRQMDVNTEVEYKELQGKKRRREVENWLANVERIENKVQNIKQAVQESGVLSRAFKLGNQVDELIGEVTELIDQGRFPQGFTLDVMETRGDPLVTTELVGQAFQRNLDKIWESLMKVDVLSIGIHGMGGVGKTTLVMHIHNKLLDSFNGCWVTVSQDFSIEKLQTKISKAIKLDLTNEDDVRKRAAKLAQALREIDKFVLILDDIWKCFSLQEVGIPIEVYGCKLILTTRFLNVCKTMCCQENVKVVPLDEKEAWNLFMEKFGHDIKLPLEVGDIARSIVKECAGLPLGIITVAGRMRGVDINIHEWRNALQELKHSEAGLDEMEDEVFRVLKFSYSNLKDPKLQDCFIYCSLFPEDCQIEKDELIEHLIDEGIIERKQSRQAELDKGHSMLNKLENAYLLEGVEVQPKVKCVKMHDLLRDMAIQIARASHRFMVKSGKALRDLPDEEEWNDDLVKVSLMHNDFLEIPSNASPRCPKLSTLMLNDNWHLQRVGYSFFVYMTGLKVLNLSGTGIKELPNSISNLENLIALMLSKCNGLTHVPSLAKLTALKRLDLRDTRIKEIPQGLEMLVNLRYLNLSSYSLKIFTTRILPKLYQLQYLEFNCDSETLKVEGEEIASLKKLETFKGPLHDIHNFNAYVRSLEEKRGPTNYLLQVGSNSSDLNVCTNVRSLDKTVIFYGCSISKSRGGGDSLVLPKDVQDLRLDKIVDLRSLCDVPSFNNAAELKDLSVIDCEGIDHIVSSSSFSSCILPLQSVVCVRFEGLDNLRVLIREEIAGSSPVPPGTFSRLKQFIMNNCENIKKLFTLGLLLQLHNLEMITVKYCHQLVEIIVPSSNEVEEEDDHNTTDISLPKLRHLTLYALPELKSICTSNKVMVCDSIQLISISHCPKLKRLPLSLPILNGDLCPPPSLKRISAWWDWWESLVWDHPNSKTVLQQFCDLFRFGDDSSSSTCLIGPMIPLKPFFGF